MRLKCIILILCVFGDVVKPQNHGRQAFWIAILVFSDLFRFSNTGVFDDLVNPQSYKSQLRCFALTTISITLAEAQWDEVLGFTRHNSSLTAGIVYNPILIWSI